MTTTHEQDPITKVTEFSARDIAEKLEEDVVFGYLHPRERLVEDELCTRFSATRHVVRQALVELENMGLIERRRNVGALVKSYTDKEVTDLYVVRDILETSAASQINFPVPADRIEELVNIQHTHDAAADSGDLRAAFHANIAFHQCLFAMTNNPTLCAAIEDFARRAHVVRFLSMTEPRFLQKARDDHWQIIFALRAQDRAALVTLCRDHLLPSRDAYLDQYQRRTGFFGR